MRVHVVHSQSKNAWNVIGTTLGQRYKWARVPYYSSFTDEISNTMEKHEALKIAQFIARQINNNWKE